MLIEYPDRVLITELLISLAKIATDLKLHADLRANTSFN
jgi:hypothetical protein